MTRAYGFWKRSVTAVLGTLLVSTLVVLAGSPAIAGGWWTYPQIDADPMSPGEEVTVSATVMFRSIEEAEAAEGRHYAYLVRGFDQQALQEAMRQADPDGWWSTPQQAIPLVRLEFGEPDTNIRHVSGSFIVPDIGTGVYSLMFCTLGCAESLGDVIPREGVYVGDPAAVRWIRDARETDDQVLSRFDGIEARTQAIQRSVAGVGERVGELDSRVAEVGRSVDAGALSASRLRERVDELEAASGPSPGLPSSAGWFVAGLALALAWSNRRRTTERQGTVVPDDLDVLDMATDDEATPAPEFVTSFAPK